MSNPTSTESTTSRTTRLFNSLPTCTDVLSRAWSTVYWFYQQLIRLLDQKPFVGRIISCLLLRQLRPAQPPATTADSVLCAPLVQSLSKHPDSVAGTGGCFRAPAQSALQQRNTTNRSFQSSSFL